MKGTVKLSLLEHRGGQHIGLGFVYDETLKGLVRTLGEVKWSQTHKLFYLPYTTANLQLVFGKLRAEGYYVDYSELKTKPADVKQGKQKPKVTVGDKTTLYKSLKEEHKVLLKGYVDYLKGKRLSEQTVKTYGYFVLRFLYHNNGSSSTEWNTRTIDDFMSQVIAKEQYSISSHRQCVGALKYLTAYCNLPSFDASQYQRPKKSKFLPTVLSKEEIIDLLRATQNLKHRAVIGLLYSGGLRIGELLQLKLNALDFDRGILNIRQGKGRKDRTVSMSEVIKPLLLNYIHTYKPKVYFIEGRDGSTYSATSVRQFLKKSCKAAGITKDVTPHSLRHSYATHMLENGVDIRYIQELLGHAKPETTMLYTHVAQKDLTQISNPLDVLVKQLTENAKGNKKVLLSGNRKR